MERVPRELNRRQQGAHFYDEHHRVFHHRARIQFAKGIQNGSRKNGAIGERFFPDLSDRVHRHLRKPFLRSSADVRESARDSKPERT